MTVLSASRAPAVVFGSDFNDPTNERLILLSAAGLLVVGLALLVGTILWWRRGRHEHPALAPLEVMGTRSWTKAPEGDRQRRLGKVRIAGHTPGADEPIRSEPVDLQALVRSVPQAFDDLREPGEVPAEVVDDVPAGFVVATDGEVVVVDEQPPAEVEAAEVAVDASANGDAPVATEVDATDVDATAYAVERPSLEPPPLPLPSPATNDAEVSEADINDQGPGALASSHGDQP